MQLAARSGLRTDIRQKSNAGDIYDSLDDTTPMFVITVRVNIRTLYNEPGVLVV